ncbi:FecR family protein [Reyranella sp.]|uniref:FecR family protein n=1 Tax=Reyranella sp. TaxID=1929291 RepID=UPI00121E1843|nr:FecR family protein [Reyranella sp.]TAJ84504.1 MAG: FecR family protein [Reyranella sp.]
MSNATDGIGTMGLTPDAPQRKAAREATDWLLLLKEEPADKDLRRRFEEWHDASPIHAASWQSTLRLSGGLEQVQAAHADEWATHPRDSSRPQPASPRPGPRQRWFARRPAAMLAGVALAACIAAFAAPAVLLQLKSDYTTATAELRTVTLDDGSEVTLAPKSAIAVDYAARERKVELLSGVAFFTVRKDSERPFIVQAGAVETTVLGTRFEVNRGDDGVTVSVEEGLVALSDRQLPSLNTRLGAGQSARVGRTGVTSNTTPTVAAWRQKLLLADDRPVGDAVADLARYYGGTIVIMDSALATRRVTGVYGLADPEASLRDIARAIGADVRRISPWMLVLSSK